jgi:hypothetical protein
MALPAAAVLYSEMDSFVGLLDQLRSHATAALLLWTSENATFLNAVRAYRQPLGERSAQERPDIYYR